MEEDLDEETPGGLKAWASLQGLVTASEGGVKQNPSQLQ